MDTLEVNNLILRELANESAIKSLLGAPQDRFAMILQRIYISIQCRIIYFIMILICTFMVVWTFIDSAEWQENKYFIVAEFIINIIVILDIIFKMKIVGLRRFFRNWANYFDIFVAFGWVSLYIIIIVMSEFKSKYFIFKGLGPHLLFIIWWAWQYLRIILLIKSQMKARENAEDVISDLDFEIKSKDSLNNQLKLYIDENPK